MFKLFKQDQEINGFAYVFVLNRYNKAHFLSPSDETVHLHFCLSSLVV